MGNGYGEPIRTTENEITLTLLRKEDCFEACRILTELDIEITAMSPPFMATCNLWCIDTGNRLQTLIRSGMMSQLFCPSQTNVSKGTRVLRKSAPFTFIEANKWVLGLKEDRNLNVIAMSPPNHLGTKCCFIKI